MIVSGSTFACEACVRGHRVSQCQHVDRPLQQIKKKGRPISQCQHCRSIRRSRSVHTKCACGTVARNTMLKQSVERDKERCHCNEGGRCICAYKKEQPEMAAVPGAASISKESTTSAQSEGCGQRSKEPSNSQLQQDHSQPSQMDKASELGGVYSMHDTCGLDNQSHNPSAVWRASPNGNMVDYMFHQEHGAVGKGTAFAATNSAHAPSSIQMLDNAIPNIDLPYPTYSEIGLFDDPSEVEEHNLDARQSAIPSEWNSHDFTTAADSDQGQGFNHFDSCGFEQPTLTDTTVLDFASVPLAEYIDPPNDDFWHIMTEPDADLGPSNAEAAPNVFYGPF
ncbi:copper fist DNA binding domain-containing protein [Ilyonectria robusta]